MASRSGSRRRALQVLFAADAVGSPPAEVLATFVDDKGKPPDAFASELARGVEAHAAEIDERLAEHAKDWTVERMPAVDRTILRLACFEIVYRDDVPNAVAIDEAVEAAKALSTDESARFVNGVLGALVRNLAD
jgi:N utilization substance protein B